MKKLSLFLLVLLVLGVAVGCGQEPDNVVETVEPTVTKRPDVVSQGGTETAEPTETAVETPTIEATFTNTPLPPTETPTPTTTPTPTATPKPVTHANIGWEGYDAENREPFAGELEIKSAIIDFISTNTFFNGVTEDDIKVVWYTADDGTIFWWLYFTHVVTQVNNDLFLYVYSVSEEADGNFSLNPNSKALNVSAMERLGYMDQLTDIQLVWDDERDKPGLVVEQNGARLWYPDEVSQILVSYDEDVSTFNLPEKPEPAADFVVVMNITHVEDVYLFPYDEMQTEYAGIGGANAGPLYKLQNNQWRAVEAPEFSGGGPPQYAFIGYDSMEVGHLYIEEMINFQSEIQILSTVHTPLAPAAMGFDVFYYILSSPVWSPDGRRLAFIAEENGLSYLAVYELDSQSWQSLVQIPNNVAAFTGPIWSPDGNWLAYGFRPYSTSSADTLQVVSYPDGRNYYIEQGCNPSWHEANNELVLLYNPTCYSNHFETAYPDGSETEFGTLIYRISDAYESVLGYILEEEVFIIHRTNQEHEFSKIFYRPKDSEEEVLVADLPTEDGKYFYNVYDMIWSVDQKWLFVPWSSSEGGQFESGAYILNLETLEEYRHDSEGVDWNFVEGWTPDNKGLVGFGRVYSVETGEEVYAGFSFPLNRARSPWNNSGALLWETAE